MPDFVKNKLTSPIWLLETMCALFELVFCVTSDKE